MAQNQNGFNNRRSTSSSSTATRTYPGTAARLLHTATAAAAATPLVDGFSPTTRSRPESAPTVFVRPLSRSQLLAPVHVGGGVPSSASLLNESSSSSSRSRGGLPPPIANRPISLETPRPDSERHRNLYLGTPINLNNSSGGGAGGGVGHPPSSSNNPSIIHKDYLDSSVTAAEQVRLPTSSRTSKNKGHSDRNSLDSGVVTLQPAKRTLLDASGGGGGGGSGSISGGDDGVGKVKLAESSILCPYCRKCRCQACSTPRPLPSRWICSETIHCGPEPLLDYVTCLCCVKALFYHCGKDHEPDGGVMCADKPCSCAPHRKFWRWGCMGAMSVVFPCLCLYWPCKGCIRLTEKAYQNYHSHGCSCSNPSNTTTGTGREVAADSSEDEDHHNNHRRGGRHGPISPTPPVIVPRSIATTPITSTSTFLPVKRK
ncbi:protein sprouty homolog 2 [Folsomia candida]|uniref:protein sprouty homolog 2 n=1 Tax=Folsomia candida TaxID=158441 RepID=UPI000B8FA30D|nr:protein sprouty homolog 2 [Folsomia candida]XP_021961166.1 protein sprouty homolog 2 [Folsomia candida]